MTHPTILFPIINQLVVESVTVPKSITLEKFLEAHNPPNKKMRDGAMWIVNMDRLAHDVKRKLWQLSDYVVVTVSCDRAYLARRKDGSESCPVMV